MEYMQLYIETASVTVTILYMEKNVSKNDTLKVVAAFQVDSHISKGTLIMISADFLIQ